MSLSRVPLELGVRVLEQLWSSVEQNADTHCMILLSFAFRVLSGRVGMLLLGRQQQFYSYHDNVVWFDLLRKLARCHSPSVKGHCPDGARKR